jgi:hypothetical protein
MDPRKGEVRKPGSSTTRPERQARIDFYEKADEFQATVKSKCGRRTRENQNLTVAEAAGLDQMRGAREAQASLSTIGFTSNPSTRALAGEVIKLTTPPDQAFGTSCWRTCPRTGQKCWYRLSHCCAMGAGQRGSERGAGRVDQRRQARQAGRKSALIFQHRTSSALFMRQRTRFARSSSPRFYRLAKLGLRGCSGPMLI